MKTAHLYLGGAVLLAVGLMWIAQKNNAASLGAAVGGAAVELVVGTVVGAGDAVATVANDPGINPLQPFGAWLGGTIYDMTH